LAQWGLTRYIDLTLRGGDAVAKGRSTKEFRLMGSFSIWHWLIVLVVFALLFGGRGKISSVMGDAAKGIRAFRDGLKNEEAEEAKPEVVKTIPEREKDEVRS
jgi:sec-independent protein translocase protein TatA